MAEGKEPDALKDLLWFIGILVVLGILWAVTGGIQKAAQKAVNPQVSSSAGNTVSDVNGGGGGIFGAIGNLTGGTNGSGSSGGGGTSFTLPGVTIGGSGSGAQISSGGSGSSQTGNYSDIYSSQRISGTIADQSPFFNQVVLTTGSLGGNANSEYLIISASKNIPYSINITGWTVRSLATGNEATIGQGTDLPFNTSIALTDETAIYLKPGDIAYINSGSSPLDGSFRVNECSGYLNQFYGSNSFYPYLYNECPALINEKLPAPPNALDNTCLDYIQDWPSCTAPNASGLPSNLSYACQQFITNNESYGNCITDHKADASFYTNQWRIYLNRTSPLWETQRETIELLDSNGKVVDEIYYN